MSTRKRKRKRKRERKRKRKRKRKEKEKEVKGGKGAIPKSWSIAQTICNIFSNFTSFELVRERRR